MMKYSILIDSLSLWEKILISKFKIEKFSELIDLINKYEVYVLNNTKFMNLIDSFKSKEISTCNMNTYNRQSLIVFKNEFSQNEIFFKELERQLINKNIYIVSLYYKNIRMEKLEILLENKIDLIEDFLCELILDKFVNAKIDRMGRIVNFNLNTKGNDVVDDWVKNINEIVDLVDFVCERIEREEVNAQ